MLYTSKEHPGIIKSILNSFLDFEGENQIEKVVFSQRDKILKEKSDLSYSLTVTPIVHDFWITIEDNKMTWKFFELKKFKEFMKNIKIGKDSPIKHQWTKFLLKCQDEENTPDDVAEIIKEGYRIMEMANWGIAQ